jgi:hypothetical protein
MQINVRTLNARVQNYLDGPDSKEIWGELANSFLFNLIGSVFLLVLGLILICTLVFAIMGAKLVFGILKSIFTLQIFRDPRSEFKEHPDRIRPMILPCIIAGPSDHALALGTFSDRTQEDGSFLARKADEFGKVYENKSGKSSGKLFDLLQDDVFHTWRRRTVPTENSEGQDLILFDIECNKDEVHLSKKVAWLAAVITFDESDEGQSEPKSDEPRKGRFVQIPWAVVEDAVSESQ